MTAPRTTEGTPVPPELANVRVLALDVDGTLTDGRVVHVGDEERQAFCVRDGQGLAWLREAGVTTVWITGRGCRATERRARELGVRHLYLHAGPKDEVLAALQAKLDLGPEVTAAMGDDLPDLALAQRAFFFAAPSDAQPEVRAHARHVTRAPGGQGAVRELAELILRAKGLWGGILERYLGPRP